jgi:hypothetical protein
VGVRRRLCPALRGRQQFLPRNGQRVKEGLHRRFTASLDLMMTVLLAAALEDAGAASVMAHVLQHAPLDPVDRTGLSTSWLVHSIWCESQIRNALRKAERGDPA